MRVAADALFRKSLLNMNELRFGLKLKKNGPFIKTVVDDGITKGYS
jgi:hypothetical protein